MKMLGNDIVTQEEFDQHVEEVVEPLRRDTATLKKDVLVLKVVAAVTAVLSLVNLFLVLR